MTKIFEGFTELQKENFKRGMDEQAKRMMEEPMRTYLNLTLEELGFPKFGEKTL